MKKVYRVLAVLLVMTMLSPATFVFGGAIWDDKMNVGIENLEWAGAEVEVENKPSEGKPFDTKTKVYNNMNGGYITEKPVSENESINPNVRTSYIDTVDMSVGAMYTGVLSSDEVPSSDLVKTILTQHGKMPTTSGEYTFYYHKILQVFWGSEMNSRYYYIPRVGWEALGDSGKPVKFGDKSFPDANLYHAVVPSVSDLAGKKRKYYEQTYNIPIKIKIQTAPLEVWHKWDDGEERVHDTTVYVGSSFNFSSHKYLPAVKWVGKTKYTLRNFKVMSGTTAITNYNLTVDSSGEITQKSLDEYTGVVREKRYTKNSKETLKFVLTYKKAIPVKKVSLDFELRLATGEPDYQKYTVHDTGLKDGLESGKVYRAIVQNKRQHFLEFTIVAFR